MSKDGGPAFSSTVFERVAPERDEMVCVQDGGLTKLDYFAAAALPCVHAEGGRYGADGAKQVAKYAFDIAEAMLAESERRSK